MTPKAQKDEKILSIITAEPAGSDKIKLFFKSGNQVFSDLFAFYPFFFLSNKSLLNGFNDKYWIKELDGKGFFRYLTAFKDWSGMWKALRKIRINSTPYSEEHAKNLTEMPYIFMKPDPVNQFLLQKDIRYFKDLDFKDIKRIQIEILPFSEKMYGKTYSPADKMISIGILTPDNDFLFLSTEKKDEKKLIREFINIIKEIDPDIIEGHRLNSHQLPYLIERARLYEIEPDIGREELTADYEHEWLFELETFHVKIPGRILIDTLNVIYLRDQRKVEFDNYSLFNVASRLGFVPENEINLSFSKISWYWNNDKEILYQYVRNRLLAIKYITDKLIPRFFYQTKYVPVNFDFALKAGYNNKLEKLILQKYINAKSSLPDFYEDPYEIPSFNIQYYSGIFENIYIIRIRSLFSSLITKFNLFPSTDTISALKSVFQELNEQINILHEKNEMTNNEKNEETDTILNLLDSFFFYLFQPKGLLFSFNNARIAYEKHTEIINISFEELEKAGLKLLETDHNKWIISSQQNEEDTLKILNEFFRKIEAKLDSAIRFEPVEKYKKILLFKRRNHAYLTFNNKMLLKGSAIIHKSTEKYLKNFMLLCIESLLTNNIMAINSLYRNIYEDLIEHRIPIEHLCKTDVLKESSKEYSENVVAGKRSRSAPYELAVKYYEGKAKAGDKINYYITGEDANVTLFDNAELLENYDPANKNENTKYYIKKLEESLERLKFLFNEEDFASFFKKDEAFTFSSDKIKVVNKRLSETEL